MKSNPELKVAIIIRFGSQVRFARETNISELRISQIIHGRVAVSNIERKIISEKLGIPENEVFTAN